MAWPPPGDPVSLRDAALGRTRRLSWGIATGALAATATLGFAFARVLPGHAAQAGAPPGGPAAQPAGASHSARPHRARSHTSQQGGQASAPPAPAPAPPPPQVISGGS